MTPSGANRIDWSFAVGVDDGEAKRCEFTDDDCIDRRTALGSPSKPA
jgi:hypothetical protein